MFRLLHTGRVCSGDYLEPNDSKTGYLMSQGFLLMMLVYIYAVLCGLGCCIGIVSIFLATS